LNAITNKALVIENISLLKNVSSDFATLGIGSCMNLRSVRVKGCDALCDSHVNLMFLMKKHNLNNVCIEYCKGISNLSLRYIVKHIDKLGVLSVEGCSGITDDGLSYLSSKLEEMSSLFFMLPLSQKKIHSINLSHTNITAFGICNKLLSSRNNQYKISKLILGGSGSTWTNSLFHALRKKLYWNALQELNISSDGDSYLTDEAFYNLSNSSLRYLNISGHVHLTGLSIASIITSNPNLHTLDISRCTSIIQNLHLFSNALRNTNLQTLVMKDCFIGRYHDDDTYESVLCFIRSICASKCCNVLKEINFEGCHIIDTRMVELLRSSCGNVVLKLNGTKCMEEGMK